MASAVEGPDGVAGAPTRPPVAIAGVDGSGNLRRLKLNSDGSLSLGTATVNIGEVQLLGADGLTLAVVNGSGAVKVDASGAAVPVTDNSGSLTVDAPVATPVWVRLSDGSAAFIGQKAMASSIPVVIASDQTSLPTTEARLPNALGANGGLKIEGVASGTVVPVSGTVTANAGSGPFPVSDNAGSLTVDAPVATPVFVRLSDGAAAITALPVTDNAGSLTVDAPVATPAFVRLSDGAAPITALPVTDNAGSLTVDAPVGTPAFVRLSDGSAAMLGSKVSASSLPVVIASDQAVIPVKGDQARASASIPNPVVNGARASAYPTKPSSVTAGQLVDLTADLEGVIYTRPRQLNTFVALYRVALTTATSTLTFTFTANTDKQLATIYHTAAAAKRLVVRRVWVQIVKTGAVAGEVQLELREIGTATAPATGNPAITPRNRIAGNPTAAEATCLALPTTAGTDTSANAPLASSIVNLAASAGTASGTGLVPQDPAWIKLYDEASADDEEMAPTVPLGQAGGYAVIGRSTAAVPLFFIVRLVFTEE